MAVVVASSLNGVSRYDFYRMRQITSQHTKILPHQRMILAFHRIAPPLVPFAFPNEPTAPPTLLARTLVLSPSPHFTRPL